MLIGNDHETVELIDQGHLRAVVGEFQQLELIQIVSLERFVAHLEPH